MGDEDGNGIAVDSVLNAYVAGRTASSNDDFPTASPPGTSIFQPNFAGGPADAFVARISLALVLEPPSLSFGGQPILTTSSPQNVAVTNISLVPATIASITVSGDFAETNDCPSPFPSPLAAGASCTISVTFTPTVAGTQTGRLVLTDGDGNTPTVLLTATGGIPVVDLVPGTLSFTDQIVGTTSAAQSVALTNSGDGILDIASIEVSGDFAETNDCPMPFPSSLAAGESCTIDVTFTPTDLGARTGGVTITSNAPSSPDTIALSGTGTTDFSVSASPTSRTISAGQTATYALMVSPLGGFIGDVSLSCSGEPQAATCSISPTSVTLDGTNVSTADVTVATTASSTVFPLPEPPFGLYWMVWLLVLTILISLAQAARRRRGWVTLAAAVLSVVLLSSCGGGATPQSLPPPGGGTPGTPSGTSSLTVTATSGQVSHSVQLTLTVN